MKLAIKQDYQAILEIIGHEQPYALALVADDSFETISLVVNTTESFLRNVKGNENDMQFYKWDTSYWSYADSDIEDSSLLRFCQFLPEIRKEYKKKKEYVKFVYEKMLAALLELKNENEIGEELIAFISVLDDSKAEQIENDSAKRINTDEQYANFVYRFYSDEDIKEMAKKAWDEKKYDEFLSLMSRLQDTLTESDKKRISLSKKLIQNGRN